MSEQKENITGSGMGDESSARQRKRRPQDDDSPSANTGRQVHETPISVEEAHPVVNEAAALGSTPEGDAHHHRHHRHHRHHHPKQQIVQLPEPPMPNEDHGYETRGGDLPGNFDVTQLLPPEAVKSVRIKRFQKVKPRHHVKSSNKGKQPGPIAAKVVFLKKPPMLPTEPEPELPSEPDLMQPPPAPTVPPSTKSVGKPQKPGQAPESEVKIGGPSDALLFPSVDIGLPMMLLTSKVQEALKDTKEDELLDKTLSKMVESHREDLQVNKSSKKIETPNVPSKFTDMIKILKEQGIPCPTNQDFARLHGLHSRWDPDGTVIEYFSPMLRTFLPVNMRGRYRGCWTTDDCIKGLNIGKIPPKRDALEGFVDRGRHESIQKKYREMSPIALDETHLDYLVEIQSFQTEALPIPIFYDILHLGMEVSNENLRIIVQEDGYSPQHQIFLSTEEHAKQLRRKIQLYGALGLESLESRRKGLGHYDRQWLKTRDELIRDIIKNKDAERYVSLQKMEDEAGRRAKARRDQQQAEGAPRSKKDIPAKRGRDQSALAKSQQEKRAQKQSSISESVQEGKPDLAVGEKGDGKPNKGIEEPKIKWKTKRNRRGNKVSPATVTNSAATPVKEGEGNEEEPKEDEPKEEETKTE